MTRSGTMWLAFGIRLIFCIRARDNADLQQNTEGDENDVETKHDTAQCPAHLPLADSDGDNDSQQHDEQEDYRT